MAVGLLLGVVSGWAQSSPPRFTLEEAVKTAIEKSPVVQINREEVSRREGLTQQASGQFDWTASAAATETTQRIPVFTPFGDVAVASGSYTIYSADVAREFRNGIVVEPSVENIVGLSTTPPTGPAYGSSTLSLQIMVPLLKGLGKDDTGAAEAAARGDVETARLLYRSSLEQQALSVATAYWTARAAVATYEVSREDEQRAKKFDEGVRTLVDTRVFPPNLLLQSEANLKEKSTATHEAELTMLDAGFGLGRILGLSAVDLPTAPLPDQEMPQDAFLDGLHIDDASRPQWIERALLHRSDYLAQRQSEVPLRILRRQAQLELKPSLGLTLGGGYAGLNRGNNLIDPLSRNLTGLNGQVGLALAWPVENNYQVGLLRTRSAALRQDELNTAQTQADVAADVCSALAEVRLRAETMANATATEKIARTAADQERRQLKSGEATVLDVINLENLLTEAQQDKISAQAGYAIAVASLRYAVGEIFTSDDSHKSFQLTDLTQVPADEK